MASPPLQAPSGIVASTLGWTPSTIHHSSQLVNNDLSPRNKYFCWRTQRPAPSGPAEVKQNHLRTTPPDTHRICGRCGSGNRPRPRFDHVLRSQWQQSRRLAGERAFVTPTFFPRGFQSTGSVTCGGHVICLFSLIGDAFSRCNCRCSGPDARRCELGIRRETLDPSPAAVTASGCPLAAVTQIPYLLP